MSKSQEILSVIPRSAKVMALIISLGLAGLIILAEFHPAKNGRPLPPSGKVILPVVLFAIAFLAIMLYGYIYGDAKRRGMRYIMWTLLAILIPNAIGIILYFILRDPVPLVCTACGAKVFPKHTFCPSCGTPVSPMCPECGKRIEIEWRNCGYCGTKLPNVLQPNVPANKADFS